MGISFMISVAGIFVATIIVGVIAIVGIYINVNNPIVNNPYRLNSIKRDIATCCSWSHEYILFYRNLSKELNPSMLAL